MDKISHSNFERLMISPPTPHSPKSNITGAPSGEIPPPHFFNSINELRSYSAALSEFICRYDELNSHINFINSSIDSKLPDHLVDATNPNQSTLTRALEASVPEAVVSERSPKGNERDCEQSHAIDASKKPEVVDVLNTHEAIDVFIEIDTSKKREETDVSGNSEEIDASNKHVEIDDILMKPGETSSDVTTAIVSEPNPNGIVTDCNQSCESVRTPKNPNGIGTDCEQSHETEEIEQSNRHEEYSLLKQPEETVPETSGDETIVAVSEVIVEEVNPNGTATDVEQSHETVRTPEILEEIETMSEPEAMDVSKTPEQTDIKPEETDNLKKPEQTDTCNQLEEIVALKRPEETVPKTSGDQTIVAVSEEVIVEEVNPNGTASDVEQSHETVRTPEILEEIDTIMTEPEAMDISQTLEETDNLKKLENFDVMIKPEQTDICKKPEEVVALKKPEEIDILKKVEQTAIRKNPKEIVILKKPEHIDGLINPLEIDASKSLEEIKTSKKYEETGVCKKGEEISVLWKHEEPETSKKSIISELEGFCRSERFRAMKRHVRSHLSEMNKLHNEIAKALKLARDPARLVLDAIGKFYLQGSKTFRKCDEVNENVRLTSVLILECFVMISGDGIEIEERDQEHAAKAAVDWRKRMIEEGGLRQRDEVDARGLLLFISGFGIQDRVFKIQDILDLIRASNVKGIATALCRSVFLIPKIPEVIDWMVKNNLEIEAADIAYTFKLEDMCHPRNILVTYLHKKIRDIQYASSSQMLEAVKQHLLDLNSVKQCLQSHNIDPSMLLPDFKIDEKIQNLEKEINEWKLIQKKPEQIDKHEKIDLLKKPEQTDICKKPKKTDTLKKHEEIDICKKPEQTDSRKKCEKIVVLKMPEQTDVSNKHEEIGVLKKPEKTDISKNPDKNVVLKKHEQTDICKNPEETVTSKKLEEAIILKKLDETDTSRVPEENNTLKRKKKFTSKKHEQTDICKNPEETVTSKKLEEAVVLKKLEVTDTSMDPEEKDTLNHAKSRKRNCTSKMDEESGIRKNGEETNVLRKHEEPETSEKSIVAVLESLCQRMHAKEMKWHVADHFSEMNQLHKEIEKALKLARNPASLVLDSIGRFFAEGSKTFFHPSHVRKNAGRLASVLILECFVMISGDGIEIEKGDQEYAAEVAIDWRKRMIKEGGLRGREEVDARGLLLFISGFGIQDHVFKIQDILDLIRASNVKGISTALRRSVFLVPKIPEIIDWMVRNNLEIEAADLAYTLKLEDKCHPRNILVTYLHKKIIVVQYDASSFEMLEALKQHLYDLNSVKQCLQSHNIDPSILLPDFKIQEKIQNLEKDIDEWKLIQKRKSIENAMHHDSKRACLSHKSMPSQHKPVDHYGMNPYDRNHCNMYTPNYSPSSVYYAPPTPECMMVHQANVQPYGLHEPYGQHYPRYGQTYDPQPHVRPWGIGPPAPAPSAFPGRRGPTSDLYHFADLVEKESRRSCMR